VNKRILVAGIGNIFHRDDAFGVVVASRLESMRWPDNVRVREFGIRGFDLGIELLEEPSLTILVDAVSRGEPPGTLYLLEVNPEAVDDFSEELHNSHGLDPTRVLAVAKHFGARLERLVVVGCEPETLEDDSGIIGLSKLAEEAVAPAIEMIRELIEKTNQSWAEEAATSEVYA
jgi:hydrogenase maturation protease